MNLRLEALGIASIIFVSVLFVLKVTPWGKPSAVKALWLTRSPDHLAKFQSLHRFCVNLIRSP
ncbi:MAG: hypothetical protein KDA84_20605 [Planctomycetaceae bacterium]|nr:hypothetical protein [Planctomycetaceae bacterium]